MAKFGGDRPSDLERLGGEKEEGKEMETSTQQNRMAAYAPEIRFGHPAKRGVTPENCPDERC